jgi:hypothetical protein
MMIKEAVIGLFDDMAPVFADRYYCRFHGPDVVRISGAWLRQYQSWRSFEPPTEAIQNFGTRRGRYAELWFESFESYCERPPLTTGTMPLHEEGGPHGRHQDVIMVPAIPTESFLVKQLDPEKTTIMRWMCGFRYPKEVPVDEAEKWYKEVHAPELKKQEGLIGFYSYKAITENLPSLGGDMKDPNAGNPWRRVTELWYKDMAAWRKANIESPPQFTPPPWGGKYPFVEMTSNFIDLKCDIDFLRGNYVIP